MGTVEILVLVCYALYMGFTCVLNIITYRRTGKVRNLVSSLSSSAQKSEVDKNGSIYLDEFARLSDELQKGGISWKRLCEVLEKCKDEFLSSSVQKSEVDKNDQTYLNELARLSDELQWSGVSWKRLCEFICKCFELQKSGVSWKRLCEVTGICEDEVDENDPSYLDEFARLSDELQKSGVSWKRLCEVIGKYKVEVK